MSDEQTGELALLNVGTGDTKISFADDATPEEKLTASRLVKDLIKKGYAVLVEVGKDEKGPLYRRALDFDEDTREYIIAGIPGDDVEVKEEKPRVAGRRKPRGSAGRRSTKRVGARDAKAVAVPRVAGG